jgi:hypothetical protein
MLAKDNFAHLSTIACSGLCSMLAKDNFANIIGMEARSGVYVTRSKEYYSLHSKM